MPRLFHVTDNCITWLGDSARKIPKEHQAILLEVFCRDLLWWHGSASGPALVAEFQRRVAEFKAHPVVPQYPAFIEYLSRTYALDGSEAGMQEVYACFRIENAVLDR